jgi:hypothetical protein
LPPVQQGGEFHSLDSARDSEAQKETIEVGFHRAPGHLELPGDFGVVTSL